MSSLPSACSTTTRRPAAARPLSEARLYGTRASHVSRLVALLCPHAHADESYHPPSRLRNACTFMRRPDLVDLCQARNLAGFDGIDFAEGGSWDGRA